MDAKILLPVRPHIKKYLEIQHGKTLVVSSRGCIPHLIYLMLEQHKKEDPALVKPSQRLIDDKEYFGYPVYVGSHIAKTRGRYLSQDNILRFNDDMDDKMREEMVRWLHHPNATDAVIDFNIIRFRDWYGITEDELPFDNLKRWYYRNRERQEKKTRMPEPEPQLVLTF